MKFNPTIDLGHILTGVLMIGSLVGVWHTLAAQQQVFSEQQKHILVRQHEDRLTMQEIAKSLSIVSTTQGRVLGILDAHLKDNNGAH